MPSTVNWRLQVYTANGSSIIGVAEVQLRAVSGGANVATGGTVTASSSFNSVTLPIANVIDGNAATWWASNGLPVTIDFVLTAPADIVEVLFTNRPDAQVDQSPGLFYLLYSDDGGLTWRVKHWQSTIPSAWTALGQTKTYTLGAGTPPVFSSATPVYGIPGGRSVSRTAYTGQVLFTLPAAGGSGVTTVDTGPGIVGAPGTGGGGGGQRFSTWVGH